MNKELKEKWIQALRSGKYKQGHLFLRNSRNGFCCLGVLCDVYNNTDWIPSYNPETSYSYKTGTGLSLIPKEVATEIGITDEQQNQLSVRNDTGKSFIEIADYIERNL
jgi:hypothetical protein